MKYLFPICLALFFYQCGNSSSGKKDSNKTSLREEPEPVYHEVLAEQAEVKEIISPVNNDSIVDSIHIGKAGNYRLDIRQFRKEDVFVEFYLYKKQNNHWIQIQKYLEPKDGISSLRLKFSDLNNDGYNDMGFQCATAARGANLIRKWFVFSPEKEKLIAVKNSDHYPNLAYNKVLNCIDGWLVYGGSSTVFLKLEADTLREFAGVDLSPDLPTITRTIYTIDKKGKRKILKEEKIDEGVLIRYSNYQPLIENTEPEE